MNERTSQPRFTDDANDIGSTEATQGTNRRRDPHHALDLKPGQKIGKYELLTFLGAGSFGEVYSATDPILDRKVAIKFFPLGRSDEKGAESQLIAEARANAAVKHDRIVRLLDHDTDRQIGVPYLVYEFVDGRPLSAEIAAKGRIEPSEALRIVAEAAQAIAVIHEAGWTHRDLKPANILLDQQLRPHIADFGLAIAEDSQRGLRRQTAGTPLYMSPEQLTGDVGRVDGRTDIWALGVILYQMLTGVLPFQDRQAIPLGHFRPASMRVSALPLALDELLARCLAYAPTDRFDSASALIESVRACRRAVAGVEFTASDKDAPTEAWLDQGSIGDASTHDVLLPSETSPADRRTANPYRGLQSFEQEQSRYFFGRDKHVDRVVYRLDSLFRARQSRLPRIVALVGPSGSGKSSIAKAGVQSRLCRFHLDHRLEASTAVITPTARPLESLSTALARLAEPDNETPAQKSDEFEQLIETRGSHGSFDAVRRIVDLLPEISARPVVLIIDQFEELFTHGCDSDLRQIFLDNLLTAISDPSGNLSIIACLRSDFLAETQEHRRFNEVLSDEAMLIPMMSESEIREAIESPAIASGYRFHRGLVDLLVHETMEREGALPLLQFTLFQLWEGIKNGEDPAETLTRMGGVGGALAAEAERTYSQLDDSCKAVAKRAFLALVQLGEGTRDTRRRIGLDQLCGRHEAHEVLQRVLNAFAGEGSPRLITLSAPVDDPHNATAEVTHEAIFDNWSTLREWIEDSREHLRYLRKLEDAARHWSEMDHAVGLLWRPPDLEILERAHSEHADAFTACQHDFYVASRLHQHRRIFHRRMVAALVLSAVAISLVLGFQLYRKAQIDRQEAEIVQLLESPAWLTHVGEIRARNERLNHGDIQSDLQLRLNEKLTVEVERLAREESYVDNWTRIDELLALLDDERSAEAYRVDMRERLRTDCVALAESNDWRQNLERIKKRLDLLADEDLQTSLLSQLENRMILENPFDTFGTWSQSVAPTIEAFALRYEYLFGPSALLTDLQRIHELAAIANAGTLIDNLAQVDDTLSTIDHPQFLPSLQGALETAFFAEARDPLADPLSAEIGVSERRDRLRRAIEQFEALFVESDIPSRLLNDPNLFPEVVEVRLEPRFEEAGLEQVESSISTGIWTAPADAQGVRHTIGRLDSCHSMTLKSRIAFNEAGEDMWFAVHVPGDRFYRFTYQLHRVLIDGEWNIMASISRNTMIVQSMIVPDVPSLEIEIGYSENQIWMRVFRDEIRHTSIFRQEQISPLLYLGLPSDARIWMSTVEAGVGKTEESATPLHQADVAYLQGEFRRARTIYSDLIRADSAHADDPELALKLTLSRIRDRQDIDEEAIAELRRLASGKSFPFSMIAGLELLANDFKENDLENLDLLLGLIFVQASTPEDIGQFATAEFWMDFRRVLESRGDLHLQVALSEKDLDAFESLVARIQPFSPCTMQTDAEWFLVRGLGMRRHNDRARAIIENPLSESNSGLPLRRARLLAHDAWLSILEGDPTRIADAKNRIERDLALISFDTAQRATLRVWICRLKLAADPDSSTDAIQEELEEIIHSFDGENALQEAYLLLGFLRLEHDPERAKSTWRQGYEYCKRHPRFMIDIHFMIQASLSGELTTEDVKTNFGMQDATGSILVRMVSLVPGAFFHKEITDPLRSMFADESGIETARKFAMRTIDMDEFIISPQRLGMNKVIRQGAFPDITPEQQDFINDFLHDAIEAWRNGEIPHSATPGIFSGWMYASPDSTFDLLPRELQPALAYIYANRHLSNDRTEVVPELLAIASTTRDRRLARLVEELEASLDQD